jgi:hypothetical protein
MKKLIPFTLERWQQGNCTVKTADGKEVKNLLDQPEVVNGRRLCGIINGNRFTFEIDGTAPYSPEKNLMLEVDCEVVYVSLFYRKCDNIYYSGSSMKQGFHNSHPNLIKEIKVEL